MGLVLFAVAERASAQEIIEYYGADHLGSVRVVFDAAGNSSSRADYLPYGEELFAPTASMPAERFTAQARDGEAGQDYFQARMFLPRSGRFNAVDPVFVTPFDPQQWNRYVYARNNPLIFTDPTGLYNQPTAPECRTSVSSYSCPSGGLVIPAPNYVPSDNPYDWGYHGGEVAFAEAQSLDRFFDNKAGGQPPATMTEDQKKALVAVALVAGAALGFQGYALLSELLAADTAVALAGAAAAPPYVLGLRNFGLDSTARVVGGQTLLNVANWKDVFVRAVGDPASRFVVSVEGLAGSGTYEKVMGAAQAGLRGGASPTNWEIAQLYTAGRLHSVTFVNGAGQVLANPFSR